MTYPFSFVLFVPFCGLLLSVMASLQERLPENVPGDFYVDSTCIDCETCSELAPAIFRDHGDQCSVHHQPENEDEIRRFLPRKVRAYQLLEARRMVN